MSLFWNTIFPAVLAGGLAGNLVTLVGNAWITEKREYKKWLRSERHKLFSQLLTIVTMIPKSEEEINSWTYRIREISQKLHILYANGTAPSQLSAAIEEVFQLAKEKKVGSSSQQWKDTQRNAVRKMRGEMAKNLNAK